jgi:prepilin signal peptidase PulO-like enzyme (type II secretory pathway)
LLAFFLGTILGAVYGLFATGTNRLGLRAKFPFGPFLAAGAIVTALWGPTLWGLYTGLFS